MTHFFVEGTPRPQGSKRPVGRGRSIEASKYLPGWRKAVTAAARAAHDGPPLDGPVTVTAVFVFPRAKALKDKPAPPHTSPSDLDKLQRAVGDSLTAAGVFHDDSQINMWFSHKRRATPGESPGAHVLVEKTPCDVLRLEDIRQPPGVVEHRPEA